MQILRVCMYMQIISNSTKEAVKLCKKNALQKFGNCDFPNFRLFEQVDKLIKITFNQKRTHTVQEVDCNKSILKTWHAVYILANSQSNFGSLMYVHEKNF